MHASENIHCVSEKQQLCVIGLTISGHEAKIWGASYIWIMIDLACPSLKA